MLYTYTYLYVHNKCIFVCVLGGGGWLRICAHVLDNTYTSSFIGQWVPTREKCVFLPFLLLLLLLLFVMMIVCVLLLSLLLLLKYPTSKLIPDF